MVIFDILEIAPDAKNLVINAHVNEADYYDDIYIKELYINTDESFLESGINKEKATYHKSFSTDPSITIDVYTAKDGELLGSITTDKAYTDETFSEEINNTEFLNLEGGFTLYDSDEGDYVAILKDGTAYYFNTKEAGYYYASVPGYCIITPNKTYPKKISQVINCNEVLDITDFSKNLLFVYIVTTGTPSSCTPCGMDDEYTIGVTFDTGLLCNAGLGYIRELADSCSVSQGFSDFILNWEGFKLLIESEHYIDAVTMFNKLFKKGVKSITSSCGCNGKVSS